MICPRCGKEIQLSDDSRFCPGCGLEFQMQTAPVVQQPIEQTSYQMNDDRSLNPEIDIQTQIAKKELESLKKETNTGKAMLYALILLVLSFVSFYFEIYYGGIFFGLVFFGLIISDANKRKKRQEMEHLAAGQKIVNVCPNCKSPDIEMSMVQTGGFTTHGTTRVADNINPLHPFTHTNVKKGNDYTSYSYGNQCHCRNCGYVFAKPEVHYM